MATEDLNHTDSNAYDCIIFYRWYTSDGLYERGRVMARLIVEVLKRMNIRVWLDQLEMSQSATREHILDGVRKAFTRARYVIILAAPGDWQRFKDAEDIHRWEWEVSLKSDKPLWLLQYGFPTPSSRMLELASSLQPFDAPLARLVEQRTKQFHLRTISTSNTDNILEEIAKKMNLSGRSKKWLSLRN